MSLKDLCVALEHFETPVWAAEAILNREIITRTVIIDPCAGSGILSVAARAKGHVVLPIDIHDWGFAGTHIRDFLTMARPVGENYDEFSVMMNPPFSKAEQFVAKSLELGARKVLCFQRFAWWESAKRRAFWDANPPTRVYICGDRASCWRHDIPEDERGSGTPTAHAWFVFENGYKGGTSLDRIYKA